MEELLKELEATSDHIWIRTRIILLERVRQCFLQLDDANETIDAIQKSGKLLYISILFESFVVNNTLNMVQLIHSVMGEHEYFEKIKNYCFELACAEGFLDIVKLLFSCVPSKRRKHGLNRASRENRLAVIHFLLQSGVKGHVKRNMICDLLNAGINPSHILSFKSYCNKLVTNRKQLEELIHIHVCLPKDVITYCICSFLHYET
jgi:hypothetical protein